MLRSRPPDRRHFFDTLARVMAQVPSPSLTIANTNSKPIADNTMSLTQGLVLRWPTTMVLDASTLRASAPDRTARIREQALVRFLKKNYRAARGRAGEIAGFAG